MPSNIDIQKVINTAGDGKIINLDLSLREVVGSHTTSIINSVANLEPWDLICFTWVVMIRRRAFDELTNPAGKLARGTVEGDAQG